MSTPRDPAAPIESYFVERWSPRAFRQEPVPEEVLQSVFEAARWAPSCFNDQPWHFLVATDADADVKAFRELLVDQNRVWADRAPVIGFVLSRRRFGGKDKPNDWGDFDTGAAWMSMVHQAWHLGYAVHGMGGFHKDKAYDVLGVPEADWNVIAAFVIGKRDEAKVLPDELIEREKPSSRKDPSEVVTRGLFGGNE